MSNNRLPPAMVYAQGQIVQRKKTAGTYQARTGDDKVHFYIGDTVPSNAINGDFYLLTPGEVTSGDISRIADTVARISWGAVSGIVDYELDLSYDNFATFITGYAGKDVSILLENASGLTTGNTLYARVRTLKDGIPSESFIIASKKIQSIPTALLALGMSDLYKHNEASGTVMVNAVTTARNGAYSGTHTVNQTGIDLARTDKSVSFNGGHGFYTYAAPFTLADDIVIYQTIKADGISPRRSLSLANNGNNTPCITLYCNDSTANTLAIFVRADNGVNYTIATTSPVYDAAGKRFAFMLEDRQNWKMILDGVTIETGSFADVLPAMTLNTVGVGAFVRAAVTDNMVGTFQDSAWSNGVQSLSGTALENELKRITSLGAMV